MKLFRIKRKSIAFSPQDPSFAKVEDFSGENVEF